jgi:putative phosphoribosyl transferase
MNTALSPVAEFGASIPCRGVTLQGDLSLPVRATGLVIFAHGSGSNRTSVRNRLVALEMHRRGLATLLFDLMTPREVEADAEGAFLRFEIPVLTERLIAATRWAQGEDHVSHLPIGYFGSSTGAAAALAAAAALPEIAAVVSRGGRTDLAGDHLTDVKAATLLIVGDRDHAVLGWNEETYRQLRCPKHLSQVKGATHLFTEPGALESVAELAGHWFGEWLGHAAQLRNGSRP